MRSVHSWLKVDVPSRVYEVHQSERRVPKPSDPTGYYTCTYDAWNRLVKVEEGEDTIAQYAYDGAKRRTLKKTYPGGQLDETRHFYYTVPSRWQVLEERVESGGEISANPDRQFVWGLRYIDDLLLRDRDTSDPKNGVLNERVYALQDANWNVTSITAPDGTVQERYAYTAYGEPIFLTPTFTDRAGRYTKGLRPTALRYPNGRLVHYTYGSAESTADALNRIDSICDDASGSPGDVLAQYRYLGMGTIVVEDYAQPEVKLDYVGDGSYSGFDRFGRVVDHKWYDYGESEVRDQYRHGYDRASNRLYRENTITTGKDEYYTYDGINRLVTFDRGDLNAQKTAISGTPVREEDWTLDPTGNWTDYLQKTSGATDLDQDRTHNAVNEITAITATTGPDWADPAHDRSGNTTTLPKPSSPTDSLTCQYDPWTRLVEVTDGQTVVGKYEYDALNRRVKKHYDPGAPDSPTGIDGYTHYFYSRSWQILETRDTDTQTTPPETLQPKYQHLWSPRYIDAPILRDENTDQDNLCDDARLYYLGDANFNVTALVDTSGDAVERYQYAPYGRVTIYDGTWSTTRSTSSFVNNVLYTGREHDRETALYHYRNRPYDSDLGAFISRDPIGLPLCGQLAAQTNRSYRPCWVLRERDRRDVGQFVRPRLRGVLQDDGQRSVEGALGLHWKGLSLGLGHFRPSRAEQVQVLDGWMRNPGLSWDGNGAWPMPLGL